jgi:hypothetical protein
VSRQQLADGDIVDETVLERPLEVEVDPHVDGVSAEEGLGVRRQDPGDDPGLRKADDAEDRVARERDGAMVLARQEDGGVGSKVEAHAQGGGVGDCGCPTGARAGVERVGRARRAVLFLDGADFVRHRNASLVLPSSSCC